MRLFFALWPSAELAGSLHAQALQLAQTYGGHAMRADTLHLTLQFLGEQPATAVARLQEAAAAVDAVAFTLNIDCLGFWPHNRILWAGSHLASVPASALAARLAESLQKSGIWPINKPARPFVPHLTLIRRVRDAAPRLPELPDLYWPCDRFVLVRSHRSARGADYEKIGEWRLR